MSPRPPPAPANSILDCIGGTPLVRLQRVADGLRTPVLAKCEHMNPGASVKDRIGAAIVQDAEERGLLKPGGLIVEGTSGNTGVALAMVAAVKGYRSIFTVPDKMSIEKIKLLRALGAEVKVTPTVLPDHPEYYVTVAKRIAAAHENAILANQFYNQANPAAHYRTTGPELWEQVAGKLTHLVGGMGTGGTLSGMSRFLKEQNRDIRVIAADPSGSLYKGLKETGQLGTPEPYKVEGVGNDKLPSTCHLDLIDEVRTLADREAFLMARRLSREEGLFVGGSSGLNVAVALQVARELDDPEALIVVLLCDTGERYLSKLHSDEWMEENGFLERRSHRAADLLTQKKTAPGHLLSATPQTTVRQALADMTQNAVTQLPVLEAGRSLGSVTEANLQARAIEDRTSLDLPLSEVMDAPFPLVSENESVERIAAIFSRKNEAILVQRAGEIAAIITRSDLIQHISLG